MNILVTGSNGQLGSEIKDLSRGDNYNFYFTDKEELDISKKENIENFVNNKNIDLIINCAAYTAVDKAENERELADLINHKAVEYLAEICKEKDIPLIHISTDYVFDGKNYRPYVENDKVNPQGFYGLTKLKGEEAFKESGAKGIIIRTSWVYSSYGKNFVKTMLNLSKIKDSLGVISDQIGTPTYARDLAKDILEIINNHLEKIEEKKAEIYHFSNEGVCSWYDFAKAIFEIKNINIKVNPIETKDYPTPAKRPHYSVLNKSKIKKEFDIKISYWRDSLKECLKRINDV
jgi:dTDP-4-dehydrorhamnose reductase